MHGWPSRASCAPRRCSTSHDEYLALEWIAPGRLDEAGAELLGRGLALTHAAGAPCFGWPARETAAGFGSLRLPNEPAADWPEFYADGAWRRWRRSRTTAARCRAARSQAIERRVRAACTS